MLAVNTNTASAVTHNALTKTSRALNTALERLSTGQRINAANDDAAGLAITSRMTSQVLALDAGIRAASDAVGKEQMKRLLIVITALVACSGAGAQQPPESEGWKKLDLVCTEPKTLRQIYPSFYVNQKDYAEWEEIDEVSGRLKKRHFSHVQALQKNSYSADGNIIKLRDLDRSTGRLTVHNLETNAKPFYDCDLRPKNKF